MLEVGNTESLNCGAAVSWSTAGIEVDFKIFTKDALLS